MALAEGRSHQWQGKQQALFDPDVPPDYSPPQWERYSGQRKCGQSMWNQQTEFREADAVPEGAYESRFPFFFGQKSAKPVAYSSQVSSCHLR